MNQEQITLVQHTFALAAPDAGQIAERFYHHLFALDPTVRHMFPADLHEQRGKLMTMLAFVVRGLSEPEGLVEPIHRLGERHMHYRVHPQHYAVVGEALLRALAEHFGSAFTVEVQEAWVAAYTFLATTMQEAATSMAA